MLPTNTDNRTDREKLIDRCLELEAKLKAQEELLKAADEVIECVEINTETHFFSINWKIKEALEKYTTLKQQQ